MECTGCGHCCLAEKCEASKLAFGDKDNICPALKIINGKYRCLIILWEQKTDIDPQVSKALGIGTGCTNNLKITR